MNINILRMVLITLLLATFFIIFNFSGQEGEKSSSISRKITEWVTKNIRWVQELEQNEKEKVMKKIEHFIRKLAHFSLYTVVGLLIMGLVSTYKLMQGRKICVSLISGVCYAISDEVHQMFVANRTASIVDVGIDSCGVVVGIFIVWLILKKIETLDVPETINLK